MDTCIGSESSSRQPSLTSHTHHFHSNEQVKLAKNLSVDKFIAMGKRIDIVLLLLVASVPAAVALVPHSVCCFVQSNDLPLSILVGYFVSNHDALILSIGVVNTRNSQYN